MKLEKLTLSVGGYLGSSYRVKLNRGALLYTRRQGRFGEEETYTIKPSPEAWTNFWRCLDEIDFWSWSGSYQPTEIIFDGTSWSAEISVGDRSMEAHGDNAYPPSFPEAGSSSEPGEPESRFVRFREAVTGLLGGREF